MLPFASSLDAVLLGVLGAVGLLYVVAYVTHIPYPIWLTLGGATIAFVPGLPNVELAPELVLVLFLPPLLTSAAYYSSIRDLRFNARPIALLSVGPSTAPSTNAVSHDIPITTCATAATAAVVASTSPTESSAIGRALKRRSRIEE